MPHQFFTSPDPEEDLRMRAANILETPKVLQDLVLIPIPESVLSPPRQAYQRSPIVQAALNEWKRHIREDDLRFGFEERRFVPRIEIYIPDIPKSQQFIKIAKAIGDIPMQADILPKNQEQAYWLKTLHYFYQARGVLLAYKLLGVIPDPIGAEGLFRAHLSEDNVRNLNLVTEVDIAEYRLIAAGESYLTRWATQHQKNYPFKHPFQLFLKIQQQAFLEGWELGPNNNNDDWTSIDNQKDQLAVRIRLLQQSPWIKGIKKRGRYKDQEQEYLDFLKKNGWYGCLILALRPLSQSALEEPWNRYLEALRDGKPAYIDDFYWRKGVPYKRREKTSSPTPVPCSSISPEQCACPFRNLGTDLSASNCIMLLQQATGKTQKTAERVRVRGVLNLLGYLLWVWA